MRTQRTQEFLDEQEARYVIISHSPAYTAQEIAASAHIPGKDMVKVVVVSIDQRMALAAVPATCDVDVEQLRVVAGAKEVSVATEGEFAASFPGCALGAMPPIGLLFGMETYMDHALAKEQYIAFNAGTHCDVIAMKFNDYRRISHPKLVHIAMPARGASMISVQI